MSTNRSSRPSSPRCRTTRKDDIDRKGAQTYPIPMVSPLPIRLPAVPGAFLALPLLSAATGLLCAHLMPVVSRALSLLAGCACAVAALMFFRANAPDRAESDIRVDRLRWLFPLLTVAIGVAGRMATVGICRRRWAEVLPPEPPVMPP